VRPYKRQETMVRTNGSRCAGVSRPSSRSDRRRRG
jgi:hypothetical protein